MIPDLEFPALDGVPLNDLWEQIKTVVKNDANLKGLVTLRLWEGNVDDASAPTANLMPWLRLTPIACPMRAFDEASWMVDFTIKFELAVAGLKINNLFLLFGAFQQAWNYDKIVNQQPVMQYLRQNSTLYEFRQAALGPLRIPALDPDGANAQPGPQNLGASGIFVVHAVIPAIS
jgi:hypothetical protein